MIKNFKLIYEFLPNNYRKKYFNLIFLSFIVNALELISIALVVPIIQIIFSDFSSKSVFLKVSEWISYEINVNQIFYIFVSIYIFKLILTYFINRYRENFTFNLHTEICSKLLKLYLSQPLNFFKEKNSSELIKNIHTEAWQACGGAIRPYIILISELMLVLILVIFLLNLYFYISIFFILTISLLSFLFFKYYKKRIHQYAKERVLAEESVLRSFIESIGAIKEIKIFEKFGFFTKNFIDNKKIENNIRTKIEILATIPRIFYEFILVIILLLFFLSSLILDYKSMDVSYVITAFLAVSIRLIPSFSRINQSLQSCQMFMISLNIVQDDFKNLKNKYTNQTKVSKLNFNNKIKINNMSFFYKNKKIIDNFSFEINKGDYIGIFGESGSGKTTLVNLILGLEKPDSGEILTDGQNINQNILGWYKNFGMVHQSNFFLNDTVKNNISLKKELLTSEEDRKIEKILADLNLEKFIIDKKSKNHKYLVGERASKLSMGEQQRLALARALYKDISVLILDEATSNLDKENESLILNKIKDMNSKNLTVLHISHDKNILNNANKLLKLQKNKIILEKK